MGGGGSGSEGGEERLGLGGAWNQELHIGPRTIGKGSAVARRQHRVAAVQDVCAADHQPNARNDPVGVAAVNLVVQPGAPRRAKVGGRNAHGVAHGKEQEHPLRLRLAVSAVGLC